MNNTVEMTWRKAIMAWFEILFQHLPGGTEETTTHLSKRRLNPALNPGLLSANHFWSTWFKALRLWAECLLTYSMALSPSWEANWFAASQEIPRISRNPKAHYRTRKRPPPVSILGKPNAVHIPTSLLLEIHPNIIHPSTPRSPQWLFPSGFPSNTLYTPLSSPIRATCPAHVILLDFITRTILGEEYKYEQNV